MPPTPKKKGLNPSVRIAKQALRSAGITRKSLAASTGTTTKEVGQLFRQTARGLAVGDAKKGGSKIGSKTTKAARKALVGGPKAGQPATKKSRAAATARVQEARKTYKKSVRQSRRRQPS